MAAAVFQRFFERVVELCRDAGLVWGAELISRATKVRANADMDSLVPRFYHDAKTHVTDLFAADPSPDEPDEAGDSPPRDEVASPKGVVHLPPGALLTAAAPEPAPRWKLLEERRLGPEPARRRQLPSHDRLPGEHDRSRRHPHADRLWDDAWATTTITWWMGARRASSSRRSSPQRT